ncbi:MAG: hypothetical protein NT010_03205 [Proteobacteria bacterium]|nr:hypothetical protein [Pseudomonadota bacterium]
MKPPYKIVFFSSLSILAFEIVLIRIFSIRLSYHYASLIISVSMIGLVIGGIYTYLKKDKEIGDLKAKKFGNIDFFKYAASESLNVLIFSLSLSYPVIFIISTLIPLDPYRMLWENIQILYLFSFIALFSIPFFLYGVILSTSLQKHPPLTGRIYASDLIGASCGVALVVFLMNNTEIEFIVVACSIIPALCICFSKTAGILKTLCIIIILVLNIPILLGLFIVDISPYKGLMQALKEDGSRHMQTIHTSHSRLDIFENPRMKQAPGLSLAWTKPIPQGLGMALDGDTAGVMLKTKIISDYCYLPFLPSALPDLLVQPENVLVVGFKNSPDVFMPYYFGAKNVYKAEKDLSILKFLSGCYDKDSLYRKSLYNSSGRMLIKHMEKQPDVVFISKTGFSLSGTFGLQEDYDMTADALGLYLSCLSKKGFLFIQIFILPPPRYELRILNNIIFALNSQGIESIDRHLLIYRTWDTINFLVKKAPFTEKELEMAQSFLTEREFEKVFPFLETAGKYISGLDYKRLFYPLMEKTNNSAFIDSYPFDIRATTDDRPFFHYFLKLTKIKEIYGITGKKWAYFLHEGMVLPFVLIFLVIVVILIFVWVALWCLFSHPTPENRPSAKKSALCYFACIGFSFMFVEVFFIHKLILPFGSPVSAFSVVLITLLISAGCGSLLSGRIPAERLTFAMAFTPLLLVTYLCSLDFLLKTTAGFTLIIPAGVTMGFFFPAGIRLFCPDYKTIPLAYAVNGAASIVAPPLASLIAVEYGLRALIIMPAILYCLALFFIVPENCMATFRKWIR